MNLVKQIRKQLKHGVAPAIRYVTTFNPEATREEMVAAGVACGLNPNTVAKQYAQARKEDAEVDAACSGMPREQFIEAVIKTITRSRS